jgi:hypothetical protein
LFIGTAVADDEDAPPDGVEVQARGQVHEAFAEASATSAAPGVVVSKTPPAAIEEAPPEEKPEGDTVAWIPGYWAWDEEDSDFLWISGFWRAVPPGRMWVPGHWQKVTTGHQWVSGYWDEFEEQNDHQTQVASESEYLPTPPDSLDNGPSTLAPSEEHTYVPGVWVYQVTKYVWRPGYWVRFRPGWVWVPACYKWTPCGYVFVSGYWDVPLCHRGLLFAPVRFYRGVYLRRGFVYRPAYVVQPDFLVGSLFVRASTRTYFFGNYFEAGLRRRYVPWVDYRISRGVYDVNYNYYRSAYVKHAGWERNLRTLYSARYAGDIARPPLTLVQQTKALNNIKVKKSSNVAVHKNVNLTNVQNVTVVAPIRKASSVRMTGLAQLAGIKPAEVRTAPVHRVLKVEKASSERLREERRQAERLAAIASERKAAESKVIARLPKNGLEAPLKVKVELPRSVPAARLIKAPQTPPVPVRIKTVTKTVTTPPVKKETTRLKKTTELPPPVKKTETIPLPKKSLELPKVKKTTEVPPPLKKKELPPPPPVKGKATPPPVKKEPIPLPKG